MQLLLILDLLLETWWIGFWPLRQVQPYQQFCNLLVFILEHVEKWFEYFFFFYSNVCVFVACLDLAWASVSLLMNFHTWSFQLSIPCGRDECCWSWMPSPMNLVEVVVETDIGWSKSWMWVPSVIIVSFGRSSWLFTVSHELRWRYGRDWCWAADAPRTQMASRAWVVG